MDNWTLDIVSIMDSIVVEVINYNSVTTNAVSTSVIRELVDEFYNLGSKAYFAYHVKEIQLDIEFNLNCRTLNPNT
jgi:hypothetical protein